MGVGGVQVGFMSGLGLGGIAERGREEDFFPSVASFSESTGKCINQKQNRFQLAQRSVGFFDQRSLHLSKVPESPVRQQEWGGDWGSVSWWLNEKEAEKDPVPPKSSRNSQEPNCSWQRPCLSVTVKPNWPHSNSILPGNLYWCCAPQFLVWTSK